MQGRTRQHAVEQIAGEADEAVGDGGRQPRAPSERRQRRLVDHNSWAPARALRSLAQEQDAAERLCTPDRAVQHAAWNKIPVA